MEEVFATDLGQAIAYVRRYGFPVKIESSFSLEWVRKAENMEEFKEMAEEGLKLSPLEEIKLTWQFISKFVN